MILKENIFFFFFNNRDVMVREVSPIFKTE